VDLYKAIRELVEEKKRIDRIIASLEAMLKRGTTFAPDGAGSRIAPAKRRGRKSMSTEERKQVSERMARYWAAKRAEKEKAAGNSENPAGNAASSS
jgi:hypothetical protein